MGTRYFENELGREILIDVSEMEQDDIGRVILIVMEGPESSATNLVTPKEAEMLRQALNDWAAQ
ncbi:hypothetical protein GCM10023232_26740 [Sphingosinicella ginsenosidimutans]|uniref:Uncharacterized protein n=1 Tax=Allosphingosinicella ginsenosidimutans TaxID=1176539 RepID=A0A5C6TTI9_9SPHN|nr:hypothetical protein [Sphingosinicella ginsenosidimutans]TXC63712.1 hypothetical protein FRZ32_08595 [Sphingosinicella ginsenosidimutans]